MQADGRVPLPLSLLCTGRTGSGLPRAVTAPPAGMALCTGVIATLKYLWIRNGLVGESQRTGTQLGSPLCVDVGLKPGLGCVELQCESHCLLAPVGSGTANTTGM